MENITHESSGNGKQELSAASDNASQVLDLAVEVLEDIQRVVSAGRPKAVRVRLGNRVLAELPVALTAAAAVAAGLAAVLLTKLAIEVVHEDEPAQ